MDPIEIALRVEPDDAGWRVVGDLQGRAITFLRGLPDRERALELAGELRDGYAHYGRGAWAEARPHLERAAEAGSADAQYAMGTFFHLALGTEVDGPAAVRWYERAAAQDHAPACHALGTLYATGCGSVAPDRAACERWLARSRALGLDLYGPEGPDLA